MTRHHHTNKILYQITRKHFFSRQAENTFHQIQHCKTFPGFEKSGPRELLFHDPNQLKTEIITFCCLSPRLNNVIKGLVKTLEGDSGVINIVGIRYGHRGHSQKLQPPPMQLTATVPIISTRKVARSRDQLAATRIHPRWLINC